VSLSCPLISGSIFPFLKVKSCSRTNPSPSLESRWTPLVFEVTAQLNIKPLSLKESGIVAKKVNYLFNNLQGEIHDDEGYSYKEFSSE
jgi:hypothetical protein